jgi:hypothetical protein
MPIRMKDRAERQKVAGVAVQDRIRKLQGRQEANLVGDAVRGAGSPLGERRKPPAEQGRKR